VSEVGVRSIKLLQLHATRTGTPAPEGYARENSYSIVRFGEKDAELRVKDRFTMSLDREFGMEFDCELKVVLGCGELLKEEELKAQIDKWMDQPALSYSNLLLGLVLEWMGVFPVVLPPQWSEKTPPGNKGKVRKAKTP
jgi:hypothetical protein